VRRSFKGLLQYGFPIEQAKDMTQALLDMGAGSGMTAEQLGAASYALGQINLSDKLLMQDLRQLMNAGVDVNSILEEMGYNLGDVGTEAISSSDFIAKFMEVSERDFGGAVDRMKGSWQGLLGTLQDLKAFGLRDLFTDALDALKPVIATVTDWLMGEGREKLKEWGKGLGEFASKIIELRKPLADAGFFSLEFRESLSVFSDQAVEIYDQIAPKLQMAFDWFSMHKEEIKGAITAIAAAFGGFMVLTTIGGILSAIVSTTGLITIAVGVLGAAWAGNWGGIRDKVAEVWGVLQPILQELWQWLQVNVPQAVTWLSQKWHEFWGVVGPALSDFWNNTALPALQGLWEWLNVNIPTAVAWLKEKWDVAWNAISAVVQYITTQIGTLLEAFQAAREGDWYTFGVKLKEIWNTAWQAISAAAETIWNNIKEKFSQWIEDIKAYFTNTDWKATGQSILEGISQGITGYMATVKKNAEATARAIWDTIRGFFGIKSPATKMIEIGKMLIEGLIDGFVGGVALVAEGVGKLVEAFKNVDWLDIGKSIVANINSGLTNSMQSLLNAANSLATQTAAKILAYNWYNVGKTVVRQLSGGISGNASILSSAISNLLSGSSSGISYSSWYYVGKQIVNYIASGVKANQSTLTGAISSLLGSAKVSADSVISNWKYSEPSSGGSQPTGTLAGATVGSPTVNVILYANVSNNLDIEEITYQIASRLRSYL
jgi:tape measure domain-containing protein